MHFLHKQSPAPLLKGVIVYVDHFFIFLSDGLSNVCFIRSCVVMLFLTFITTLFLCRCVVHQVASEDTPLPIFLRFYNIYDRCF